MPSNICNPLSGNSTWEERIYKLKGCHNKMENATNKSSDQW